MNLAAGSIIVDFNSVSFSYGDVRVLENASFHIHRGEFAAMVGPNGSGKTTVLKLLFGLEKPSCGTIQLSGTTAYVSQQMPSDNLFPIMVRDIVKMGLLLPLKRTKINDAVAEALEKTGITELAARSYYSLSGGQKRRVFVARALAARPELLVLDEPTANMDMESEERLYETLGSYKNSITILIVTHNTEFVTSLTDRVLCLGDGLKIVQHKTEENDNTSSMRFSHGKKSNEVRVLHSENVHENDCCRIN